MRVLFFNWEYPPQGSGIGRYNEILTRALRNNDHFCVIVTSTATGCPEIEKLTGGVVYRLCAKEEMASPQQAERVLEIAAQYKVDLIEGADHLGHCASLLGIRNRPPVCIKMHYNDVLHDLRYAQAAYWWQRPLIGLACIRQHRRIAAERYSIEKADFITAPCREIFLKAQQQGVRLPGIKNVIANPVELPESWMNAETTNPTLLFVGRVDFGKGVQYLPQLLCDIRKEFPAATLEIAGHDCCARGVGSLLQWVSERVDDGAIRYLGPLNREDLDEAYKRAWVVIVPSKWDTFPNIVLEAMARSKAIVSSPFGGAKEMLQQTKNVIEQPGHGSFSQAICRFLADSELRRRAGEQGRVGAEQEYSPDCILREYVDWFAKVL